MIRLPVKNQEFAHNVKNTRIIFETNRQVE